MNATATLSETIHSIDNTLSEAYETATTQIAERTEAFADELTTRLEEFEGRIPELPKKVVAYNRAAAQRAFAQARRNNELFVDAFRPVVKVADNGVRTVVGTTKWAIEQTADTATTGTRTVVGQAKAQFKRTFATLNGQAVEFVEEATDRVATGNTSSKRVALKSMTKAELTEIAKDLDIAGRTTMTKAQLIAAINA